MRKLIGVVGVFTAACALGLAAPQGASAARLVPVAAFSSPTFVVAPRGATSGTLFVVERAGRVIRYYRGSRVTFADIRTRVSCCDGERGLLSMAFDPGWSTNRRVYFYYTNNSGDIVVARFRANSAGTRIFGSTFHRMLLVGHRTYSNHNGGQLAFGPDGNLYAGTGDGGGGCDPFEAAQNLSRRLGKILRINPSTGAISIFMYGVRNPWRFSFDRANGNFWLGDVGQGTQEEIDFRSASQLSPAQPWNGGWDVYEGRVSATQSGCDGTGLNSTGTLVHPFSVYGHTGGNCSITGGYVYRGQNLAIRGWYVYGDYCTGNIWRIRRGSDGRLRRVLLLDSSANISSFGEGAHGEIYVADLNGTVYRLARSS
jgi:Glucose / Sorbosone dehydrogenase